ncbi:MAG: PKD domain-containing protein [Acidobacteriota bacterium]
MQALPNFALLRRATPSRRSRTALLVCLCAVSLLASCDSSNPVAPEGTVLTLTANPARIASDSTSQIRVVARRPNGTPVNPGTIILLGTTIGRVTPSVETDSAGEAVGILEGNGEFGMATVTATVGSSEAVTADVQIGLPAGSISVQATPSTVAETGGSVTLLAIVRDDQGQALPDAEVNFRTETGSLASGGRLLTTANDGSVSDELTIEASDLDVLQGDTFQVEAEVGGNGGSLVQAADVVSIQRLPVASFTFGTQNLTVVFTDTTEGNPTRWQWNFGNGPTPGESSTSLLQNPSFRYSAAGTYTVTLTVSNSLGSDTISQFVSVSGQ